jgi:short-subunit dehydrogenase
VRDPRSILITGASSGLGEALARAYARPGVFLALVGRHAGRLAQVGEACRAQGATVAERALDVALAPELEARLLEIDQAHALDLVIANAGVSGGTGRGEEPPDQVDNIIAVNVHGVVNTVAPLLPTLAARGRGQIALMSSLASFRGFPGAPTYCATKAWVRVWGEGLRVELARKGIEVSVICPGFVDTRMTQVNRFPMPFLMTAERAARIIVRGLARNRGRIAFPWPMYALSWLLQSQPPPVSDALLRRAPRKV